MPWVARVSVEIGHFITVSNINYDMQRNSMPTRARLLNLILRSLPRLASRRCHRLGFVLPRWQMDNHLDRTDCDELDLARLDLKAVGNGAKQRHFGQRVDKGLFGFERSSLGSWR